MKKLPLILLSILFVSCINNTSNLKETNLNNESVTLVTIDGITHAVTVVKKPTTRSEEGSLDIHAQYSFYRADSNLSLSSQPVITCDVYYQKLPDGTTKISYTDDINQIELQFDFDDEGNIQYSRPIGYGLGHLLGTYLGCIEKGWNEAGLDINTPATNGQIIQFIVVVVDCFYDAYL